MTENEEKVEEYSNELVSMYVHFRYTNERNTRSRKFNQYIKCNIEYQCTILTGLPVS